MSEVAKSLEKTGLLSEGVGLVGLFLIHHEKNEKEKKGPRTIEWRE